MELQAGHPIVGRPSYFRHLEPEMKRSRAFACFCMSSSVSHRRQGCLYTTELSVHGQGCLGGQKIREQLLVEKTTCLTKTQTSQKKTK